MNKSKDEARRELILNGSLWLAVLAISGPMMFMNILTYLYNIIDQILVADIGALEASAVAITNQIKGVLQAVNIGFSIPCTILIARLIGSNDFAKAKKLSHLLIVIGAIISLIVCMIGIFGARIIMIISNVPDTLIDISQTYFTIQVVTLGFAIFNGVFLSFEKARGATVNLLYINIAQIVLKILLTVLFVKVLHYGVNMVAVATLIPTVLVFIFCIFRLASKNYLFHFSKKAFSFDKTSTKAIFNLAIPIFLGKFIFSSGKVISNAMVVALGDTVVGALSISNSINAGTTTITESMEESLSVMISQNLGNGNKKRAINAFYLVLVMNIVISTIGMLIYTFGMDQIIMSFARDDADFYDKIYWVLTYERFGVIALGINSAVMGLMYGFGYTKASYILSIARLFLFRIPMLYVFINFTDLGVRSAGIAMLVSNLAVGVISAIFGIFLLIKIHRTDEVREMI